MIWLVVEPSPLKNHGVRISWDDFTIPNMMGKIIHSCSKHFQTTKQIIINHYSYLILTAIIIIH
jgi:hypothetical protein